ncbi:hypothetical protein FFZ99_09970 [Leptospira interrogans]|nr:hypothetical protein BW243_03420 [Leptospira interrogans serovar Pomona]TQE57771.1 hypothetical protein FF006_09940 [Leptospira interrogans]TQE62799.1 hypothetical protein FFZ99_09970 [Leptospira interrogans]TQE66992.1 hypothetical protein FF001_08775 [Leptospira interrogans]TQE73294.1 hypothetical protein FF002_10265 [Leptospira interrogans]
MLPNLEPLRMFEVLEKNENFGGKHEETFYYIVLSRLVFKLYFEFIVNLILYVVVPTNNIDFTSSVSQEKTQLRSNLEIRNFQKETNQIYF